MKTKTHFDWLHFLILSSAIAAPVAGAVATTGPAAFVNPEFDLALFNSLVNAVKGSVVASPAAAPVIPSGGVTAFTPAAIIGIASAVAPVTTPVTTPAV